MSRKHHFAGKAAALILAAAMTLSLPAWSIQAAETDPAPGSQTEESGAPESPADIVQDDQDIPAPPSEDGQDAGQTEAGNADALPEAENADSAAPAEISVPETAAAEGAPEAPVPADPADSISDGTITGSGTDENGQEPAADAENAQDEAPAQESSAEALTASGEPAPEDPAAAEEDLIIDSLLADEELVYDEDTGEDNLLYAATADGYFSFTGASLTLSYDDRYLISKKWSGFAVVQIRNNKVTSYVVSKGSRTGSKDKAVLRSYDNGTGIRATGVGTCEMILGKKGDLSNAKKVYSGSYKPKTKIKAYKVSVTVKTASLSLFYLLGQSNMEGLPSGDVSFYGKDSVACTDGQVYSTYGPQANYFAVKAAGIDMAGYLNGANAKSFVAESLVSNTSMTGSTLKYKLNTLTYAGKGKGGMDGALAYEWNKLTGSKVWVANFAAGSTSIAQWAPGGKIYNAVLPALMAVAQVARAEENAGHFNVLYRIGLWQQGENDSRHGVSESAYLNQFTRMYQSLDSKLNLDKFGIIPTRACQGNNKTSGELNMDGPRAAQYAIAQDNTTFKDVFIVSNANESWTSDSGVKNYFKSFYPSGKLTYPLRSNTSISRSNLPDSVRDVHPSIHYSQLGYNQNGITAALGMYDVVKGKVNKSSLTVSGYFRGKSGTKITGVTGSAGGTARVFFMTGKPQALKRIVYKGTNVTYDKKTGTVKFTAAKNGRLSAVDSVTGKTLATITVKFNGGWISSGGKTYFYKSATSKITGLVKINGYRYYFDKNGVQQTGFVTIKGNNYYFYKSTKNGHYKGVMATGWQTINGFKYYFNSNGTMATGFKSGFYFYKTTSGGHYKGTMAHNCWIMQGGRKFYMTSNGYVSTGWKKIGGKTYYFHKKAAGSFPLGAMATGWTSIGKYKYYFTSEGRQTLGLKKIGGHTYYFYKTTTDSHYAGTAATGWVKVDNVSYYFLPAASGSAPAGSMAIGWTTVGKLKYFFDSKGKAVTGFATLGGSVYYFWPSTTKNHYRGTMATGWASINDCKYYFGSNGKEQTGFRTIDGKSYYFWPSTTQDHYKGTMATGKQTINGKTYTFGKDGVMKK